MLEGSDPNVAPLRRALAVWGLTIDDIGVASVSSCRTLLQSCKLNDYFLSVPRYFYQSQRQERKQCLQLSIRASRPNKGQRMPCYRSEVAHWTSKGWCRCLDDERHDSDHPGFPHPWKQECRQYFPRNASIRVLGLPISLDSDRWYQSWSAQVLRFRSR